MKRRDVLKSGLVLAGTTAVAAPAIAQSAPTIRWRLTSSFPKSLETIYGGGEFFAERVNKLTDGKFNIRVFAAGDLVPFSTRRRPAGTVNCTTPRPTSRRQDFTMGFGGARSELLPLAGTPGCTTRRHR
jgi:TRAP-type mannitol/chloroaromatic compound transport system substrate-binding protein